MFSKSQLTYVAAIIVILVAFALSQFGLSALAQWFYAAGVFSLAGSLTNGMAIYMLFEKIPFLIGSGVIPNRFEAFKGAIKALMMEEFFNENTLREHWEYAGNQSLEAFSNPAVIDKLPLNRLFDDLVDSLFQSSLGSMLKMLGGHEAAEPLRKPLVKRMRSSIAKLLQDPTWMDSLIHDPVLMRDKLDGIRDELEKVIDARLNELTPQLVKMIVQKIIREHLGWLVIWGGVFGGIMGVLSLGISELVTWLTL